MQKSYIRILCLLLMICTLFAGVGFDEDKADAIFENPFVKETFCYMFSDSQITDNSSDYPSDLFVNHKSLTFSKSIQQETKKSDIKIIPALLIMDLHSLSGGSLNKSSSKMDYHDQSSKELLTSYIHKSDGKKRI